MTTNNPRPSYQLAASEPAKPKSSEQITEDIGYPALQQQGTPNWVHNGRLLWESRRILLRTAVASSVLALSIAFAWPKQYESSAQLMPPSSSTGGAALLAALVGHAGGLSTLGALAGGFLGGGGNTPLFIDLLRSGSISGRIIDRFHLQQVYHKRYRSDAAKYLAHHTKIVDDKRSGVITLTVTDNDPFRARDIAQCYLDQLNLIVNKTTTSSAHQERLFVEKRLQAVHADLTHAQKRLSDFSSTHATIDIKEQTRAMVDAASRIQAQLIAEQSTLDSMKQVYGDGNVRVREAQVRIAGLRKEVARIGGTSQELPMEGTDRTPATSGMPISVQDLTYPALRQLPRLAVPYADLYREVRIQESVYELLTQQYELARIQEAKDVPVISVIDSPGIPEKKSFPPRLVMALALTAIAVVACALVILLHHRWRQIDLCDPRKTLIHQVLSTFRKPWITRFGTMRSAP